MPLGHTRTYRHRKVRVVLRDGTVIEDRFLERPRCKRWVVLERHGRVALSAIKSFTQTGAGYFRGRIGS